MHGVRPEAGLTQADDGYEAYLQRQAEEEAAYCERYAQYLIAVAAAGGEYWYHRASIGDASRLREAVRNAIAAYARTGRMVDAALEYTKAGFPVFPVDARSKVPIPKRDFDPSGEYPDGVPQTGGHYKATTDPLQIRRWWKQHPNAAIGLPTGKRSGCWVLDIDTDEDHADGVRASNKLASEHEPIVTREHRSATGGPHLFFAWDATKPLGCSKGLLPDGLSVKGQGGYVLLPPSVRKKRAYTVFRDVDPVAAPAWLVDLIQKQQELKPAGRKTAGRKTARRKQRKYKDRFRKFPKADDIHDQSTIPAKPTAVPAVAAAGRKRQWDARTFPHDEDVDLDELADALRFVGNPDLGWDEWTSFGLAIFAASGGSEEGFALFDAFSQLSSKYNAYTTRARWQEIKGSPPNRTGAGKIFALAYKHGWRRKLRYTKHSGGHWQSDEIDVEKARREVRRLVRQFFQDVALNALSTSTLGWWPQWALRAPTGVSKTGITIDELAYWLPSIAPVIYTVPLHKLSIRIEEQFAKLGIRARIFYGRDYPDPDQHDPHLPADQQVKMCLNLDAVGLATLAHADVTESCCKSGKRCCPFISRCGYMRQQVDAEKVQVWIVASDMLFHAHKVFGEPAAVIVDEAFWSRGVRIGSDDDVVPIASLIPDDDPKTERDWCRSLLGKALREQADNGPLERRVLADATAAVPTLKGRPRRTTPALTPSLCSRAISLEWEHMPPFELRPGMTRADFFGRYSSDLIKERRHCWNVIYVWEEVRNLLENSGIELSGRLQLVQDNGLRAVKWSYVAEIKKKYQAATLLLDATLPQPPLLQVYHPDIEVKANLKVGLPECVHVRQVLDAPSSSNKLKNEDHLEELRRYIWRRWFETGRKSTLVITQKKAETWLKRHGLPPNVAVEHFNNISGIDDYSKVRLLILIGRTAPPPNEIEALAGVLSGQEPTPCPPVKGKSFIWYPPVERAIRLRDGRVIKSKKCDQHPDAFAELVRWQIHEGELVQAYGRARAINRSDDTDIDLLFNTALPITVSEVEVWKRPSLLMATAIAEGVMLTAPCDLVKLWPALWPNEKAAYRTVSAGVPRLPGFVEVKYQLRGAKMKPRIGYFDPAVISDPRAWLQAKLGPIVLL
jgi:bifunctional DNA primase/polymerase-like protein/primase-like protein